MLSWWQAGSWTVVLILYASSFSLPLCCHQRPSSSCLLVVKMVSPTPLHAPWLPTGQQDLKLWAHVQDLQALQPRTAHSCPLMQVSTAALMKCWKLFEIIWHYCDLQKYNIKKRHFYLKEFAFKAINLRQRVSDRNPSTIFFSCSLHVSAGSPMCSWLWTHRKCVCVFALIHTCSKPVLWNWPSTSVTAAITSFVVFTQNASHLPIMPDFYIFMTTSLASDVSKLICFSNFFMFISSSQKWLSQVVESFLLLFYIDGQVYLFSCLRLKSESLHKWFSALYSLPARLWSLGIGYSVFSHGNLNRALDMKSPPPPLSLGSENLRADAANQAMGAARANHNSAVSSSCIVIQIRQSTTSLA